MNQTTQAPGVKDVSPATIRRNRLYFVLGGILVLGIGGMFAWGTSRALYVRSITGSVFADYVVKHHIGTATVTDDASGFQGDFCVLTVNQRIPMRNLEKETEQMAWQYYNLDGGTLLTIQYEDPKSHKTVIQSTANYLQSTQTLNVDLRQSSKNVSVHEDWPSAGGN